RRVNPYGSAGWHGADIAVNRKRFRNAAKEKKTNPARRFGLARNSTSCKQRFNLRCKSHGSGDIRIIERLDPVRVTRKHQRTLVQVPDSEREHPPETVEHRFPHLGVQMKEDLCIGIGPKNASLSLEFASQCPVVVDFTIEYYDMLSIDALHRLGGPLRKVNNGKPSVGQANAFVR